MATLKLAATSTALNLSTPPARLSLAGGSASIDLGTTGGAGLDLGSGGAGPSIGAGPPAPDLIAGALVHEQRTPAAVWQGIHPYGRMPDVTTYVDGEEVDTDVSATPTSFVITWPEPTAGVAIIR